MQDHGEPEEDPVIHVQHLWKLHDGTVCTGNEATPSPDTAGLAQCFTSFLTEVREAGDHILYLLLHAPNPGGKCLVQANPNWQLRRQLSVTLSTHTQL